MELADLNATLSSSFSPAAAAANHRFNPLQPVFIGLIFFAIFLISIGTIVYLSFSARNDDDGGGGDSSSSYTHQSCRRHHHNLLQSNSTSGSSSQRGDYTPVKLVIENANLGDDQAAAAAAAVVSSSSSTSCVVEEEIIINDRMIIKKI